jgi:hypothetical protein
MLTLRTKENFEKWLKQQQNIIFNRYNKVFVFMGKLNFYDLPEIIFHSYIIEWFDTSELYIAIENYFLGDSKVPMFRYVISDGFQILSMKTDFYSRNQCLKEAIERTNEIYNSRFVAE